MLTDIAPAAGETVVVAPRPEAAASAGSTVPAATLELGTTTAAAGPIQHWTLPRSEQVAYQVKFAFDSAALAPRKSRGCARFVLVVKAAGVQQFRIIGHTDASDCGIQ